MKREKMKKYICLIIGFLMFVTGCSSKIDNDKIIKYLENKYNQSFSYVSLGDDVWSSKSETKIFSDNNNREFEVEVFSNYIADTYYSIIYDDEISKYYQNQFTKNYKIFASSESYFTNENQKYSEVKDYMNSVPSLSIAIYTTDNDLNIIKSKFDSVLFEGQYISGVVYIVAEKDFDNITKYNYKDMTSITVTSKSFTITNNTLEMNWL